MQDGFRKQRLQDNAVQFFAAEFEHREKYDEDVRKLLQQGKRRLFINWNDLYQFEEDLANGCVCACCHDWT